MLAGFHPRAAALAVLAFAGIVAAVWVFKPSKRTAPSREQLTILTTFLPMQVFTLNVVGSASGVAVKMLLDGDLGCPHDYALRPADLMKFAEADVLVANGLGMEPFLDELIRSHPNLKVLTISDECDWIPREGAHEEHDHDHGRAEFNGHVWVSPREAAKQARTLARKLGAVDPPRAKSYEANGEVYAARLEALHQRMVAATAGFAHRNIVTLHDAFAYLARDLGLNVVATLESEPGHFPSAQRMTELIETIQRKGAAAVFYEPTSSDRIARAIARDAGAAAYPLNPFTSPVGAVSPNSYEEIALTNLEVLSAALGNRP